MWYVGKFGKMWTKRNTLEYCLVIKLVLGCRSSPASFILLLPLSLNMQYDIQISPFSKEFEGVKITFFFATTPSIPCLLSHKEQQTGPTVVREWSHCSHPREFL